MPDLLLLFLGALAGYVPGYILGVLRDQRKTIFEKKLLIYTDLMSELSKHRYINDGVTRDDLISLLAPARLISDKELEEVLREYYSSVQECRKTADVKDQEKMHKTITSLVMRIEQLMRSELSGARLYTDQRISKHTS